MWEEYDMRLYPIAKEVEPLDVGSIWWEWLLDNGVGYVILTGKAVRPLHYRYQEDNEGNSPRENHGFFVSEEQAKMMAVVTNGLVFVEKDKWIELEEECTESERKKIKNAPLLYVYHLPTRKNFIQRAEEFISFAEESGGFYIGQSEEIRDFELFIRCALEDYHVFEGVTRDTVQVQYLEEDDMIDGKHWRTHLEEEAKEEGYQIVIEDSEGDCISIRKIG